MKKVSMIIIVLLVATLLSGCRELTERTHITDYVTVTDAQHNGSSLEPYFVGGHTYLRSIPETNIVCVSYKDIEDKIDNKDYYEKCKDKIGEKVKASIRVDKYDDDTVKYIIESIE